MVCVEVVLVVAVREWGIQVGFGWSVAEGGVAVNGVGAGCMCLLWEWGVL